MKNGGTGLFSMGAHQMCSAEGTSQPKDSAVAEDVRSVGLVRLLPLARVLKFWIIAQLFLNMLFLFEFFSLDIKTGLAVLGGQKTTPINSLNEFVGAIFPLLFLGWLYVATRNLARNGTRLLLTPAAAIYSWLIPILFFWRPYQAVSQVWRASLYGTDWQAEQTPRRIKLWWGSFWVALICVLIAILAASELASSSAGTPPDGALALVALSYISGRIAGATSLFALYSIVGRVSAAHDEISSKRIEPTSTLPSPVDPAAATARAAASSAQVATAASASVKSGWTKPGMAAAAVVGFVLMARLVNNASEPALNDAAAAQRCVQQATIPREAMPGSFTDWWELRNSCRRPLNVRVCTKIQVQQLLELFGAQERWNCELTSISPGGRGPSGLMSREDNNLIVQGLSMSSATWMACFSPLSPVSTGARTFRCE